MNHYAFSKLINLSLLITLVISIIYLVIGLIIGESYDLAISYFIGALTNILGLTLIKNDVNKKFDRVKNQKHAFGFTGFLLRFVIYGVVLYISTQKQTLNPYILVTGFFTVRIAIFIFSFKYRND